jgi:hypothetical protein
MTDSVTTRLFAPLDALLLVALLAAGSWGTWRLVSAPRGGRAVVWVDGKRTAWYPLDGSPKRDSIQGALGDVVVEHGGGGIHIVSAPCPGKLCVKQGSARKVGGKLVCVPSRVVVSIEGDLREGEALDAIH